MNISSIKPNTSFCATLNMSKNYRAHLYRKTDTNHNRADIKKNVDSTIKKIEDSPIKDSYRLENTIDLKRRNIRSVAPDMAVVTPLNIVYKNDEKLGVYPGREKRFIKCFEKSLDLQVKYPEAFKKIGMEENDIIRMCNEFPNSSQDEINEALEKIENSKNDKHYSISSRVIDAGMYSDRKNILKNENGKTIKKKTSSLGDFVVLIAKKYF